MILRILSIIAAGAGLAVLQSTLFTQIIPFDFVPDLAMLLLLAASWRYGAMVGQIAGFFIGLALDSLSLAPLGFHALLFTLIGYLYGRLQGNTATGSIFSPVIAALAATLIKYTGASLLALVFGLNSGLVRYFTFGTLWETLANLLLAPFVFLIVKLIGNMAGGRKGGF